MVYRNNPWPSADGLATAKKHFDLIFKPDAADPTKLNWGPVINNRDYFNSNRAAMVKNAKKMTGGYEPIYQDHSQDSGIYMCNPAGALGGCGKVDFMYNWEFIDFGMVGERDVFASVVPSKTKIQGQTGYCIMTRFRCIDTRRCKDCNASWATRQAGSQDCIYCGSSDTEFMAGCGRESNMYHMVKELTMENWQAETEAGSKDSKSVGVIRSGMAMPERNTQPFAFRITYGGVPYDRRVDSFSQACSYIPNLEVGYRANVGGVDFYRPNRLVNAADNTDVTFFGSPGMTPTNSSTIVNSTSYQYDPKIRTIAGRFADALFSNNDAPSRYPISGMRFAFTKERAFICQAHTIHRLGEVIRLWADYNQRECYDCGAVGQPQTRDKCHFYDYKIGIYYGCGSTNLSAPFATARPLDNCPICGNNTDFANIVPLKDMSGQNLWYPRKKLFINWNDRENVAWHSDGRNGSLPPASGKWDCIKFLLDTDDADDGLAYELHLSKLFSSNIIPQDFDQLAFLLGIDNPGGGQSVGCPEGPGGITDCLIDDFGNVFDENGLVKTPRGAAIDPSGTQCLSMTQAQAAEMGWNYQGDGVPCTQALDTGNYPRSGATFPGCTWVVTEGRTQSCYYYNRQWIDNSMDCRSYTFTNQYGTLVTYPRFTISPWEDPRTNLPDTDPNHRTIGSGYAWLSSNIQDLPQIMVDWNHNSNRSVSGVSDVITSPFHTTHKTSFLSMEVVDGQADKLYNCNTCQRYAEWGWNIARSNDPNGAGNPYGRPWHTIGGANNLKEAYESGFAKYYPGAEVLYWRQYEGIITGWVGDLPQFNPYNIGRYSEQALHQEIERSQSTGGWWHWVHDPLLFKWFTTPGSVIVSLTGGP